MESKASPPPPLWATRDPCRPPQAPRATQLLRKAQQQGLLPCSGTHRGPTSGTSLVSPPRTILTDTHPQNASEPKTGPGFGTSRLCTWDVDQPVSTQDWTIQGLPPVTNTRLLRVSEEMLG